MITIDLHGMNVDSAIYNLNNHLKMAKKDKDRLLYIITGYGSSGKTHKIKNKVIEVLDEYKMNKYIKDYLLGSEIDIFNLKYQSFPNKNIPENIKNERNLGAILVAV